MGSVNKVLLLGNLGRDPEIRYLPSGDPVASFSLATTESWKDKGGKKREDTSWHQIEVFGALAKVVQEFCSKGKQVYIEGTLHYDEWTDKDGVKKVRAKVKLAGPNAKLVLLGGNGSSGGDSRGGGGRRGSREREQTQDHGDFQVDDSDVPF